MEPSIQKLRKMKKCIFWINAHPPIEKRSNKGWNTPIQLGTKGPSIKVTLIFLFLTMTSTYVFITNSGLNGYVSLLEKFQDILDKLIRGSRNVCGFLALNEMLIELASLIIYSIKYNLRFKEPYQHFHLKYKNSIIYRKSNNFVYLKRNFHSLKI